MLMLPFTLEETLSATKSIPIDSAPGIDGFSSAFFVHSWNIVGQLIVDAANEFLMIKHMPKFFTHTCLALIPKIKNPSSLTDFRPISLCTTFYKIVAKLIGGRLAILLPKLISANQSAFIRGRSIFDNISLAQEIIREIGKREGNPNVIFSLGMHKAYDRLKWDFLMLVLQNFGFSLAWREIIMACVSSCSFSVVFQGVIKGFFLPSRGLRQGDPLSPSLFILVEDVLSRALNRFIGDEDCFSTTNARCPTHVAFADNIIIFACAKQRSITKFLDVIRTYQSSFGQLLNRSKCLFFLPKNAFRSRIRVVANTTGFRQGKFPFRYLGVPIGPGKRCVQDFQPLLNRIRVFNLWNRIREQSQGWKTHLLSDGGRLTLIKHVLSSILIHTLVTISVPEWCTKK